VIFEIKQYYSSGTLDIRDIIYSLAGGVASYLILVYIGKGVNEKEH